MAMIPSTALSRTEILAKTSIILEDTEAKYVAANLVSLFDDALKKLSEIIPYQFTDTLESDGTVNLDGSDLLPTLLTVNPIIKAEYPEDIFSRVEIFGTTIKLLDIPAPVSGEDVTLYCNGVHDCDDTASTLSASLEPVMAKMVAGLAAISKARNYTPKVNPNGAQTSNVLLSWGRSMYSEALTELKSIRRVKQKVFNL